MTYRIANESSYFSAGTNREREQVLVGILLPHIAVYRFSTEGKFLLRVLIPLRHCPSRNLINETYVLDSNAKASIEQELMSHYASIGFVGRDVDIQKFLDSEKHVGIADLPTEYEDFLDEGGVAYDEESSFIRMQFRGGSAVVSSCFIGQKSIG